jgi:osmotically-inducible protein OsmY
VEPIGNYPIHIIVKGGRIQLLGVVDIEAVRTAAELAPRGVSGSFGVGNAITLHRSTT